MQPKRSNKNPSTPKRPKRKKAMKQKSSIGEVKIQEVIAKTKNRQLANAKMLRQTFTSEIKPFSFLPGKFGTQNLCRSDNQKSHWTTLADERPS